MRTTVTLDDDTEQIVRSRMRSKHVSFKQALNDAIREGTAGSEQAPPYRVPTFDMGRPKIDLTKALQLAGELDDEHQIEVMKRASEDS